MAAEVIDGRAIAAAVRAEIAEDVARFTAATGRAPGLATVLVGDDPASQIYVANKHKACAEAGIASINRELPADTPAEDVVAALKALNADPAVNGILLQRPLPDHLDDTALTALLDRHDVVLEGARAVVVGRSDLVGKPVAHLLLHRNATVTICHSRTRDLGGVCATADVLVAAVGRPRMIAGDWVKPGAAVLDVGINRSEDGLVGDVDFAAAAERAALITPVPRGVGPMTIALLLRNTLEAARLQASGRPDRIS
jgi:methylenetetrahydrofolate dehydrogenase (NADP+)/methenyltetrahydrofolate cyclohydrolase